MQYGQFGRGLWNPAIHAMSRLEYVLKGVKKATPESSGRRLSITPTILRAGGVAERSLPPSPDARMLWAASCLGFFVFLRSGEIVCPTETSFDPQSHLAFADIAVDSRSASSAIRDAGSHQGVQDRSLPARGYTAYRRSRRRTLPGGGSAHVHGLQGWRSRSAIYQGGRLISHP